MAKQVKEESKKSDKVKKKKKKRWKREYFNKKIKQDSLVSISNTTKTTDGQKKKKTQNASKITCYSCNKKAILPSIVLKR